MKTSLALRGSFLLALASAKMPGNKTSRLMIHIPHRLFKEEGYDHREALFGIPEYGGSIAQNVYYADSDFCDPNEDPNSDKQDQWQPPYILMVDRGVCSFVMKVRNAQRSGAAAVLIADNTCRCSDTTCRSLYNSTEFCEISEPLMADDGSGSDISIPSFLMFKIDADSVKEELANDRPVQMEMSWELPSPDDRVEYSLWTTPKDHSSEVFLLSFKDVALALGERAYFTPHMYIYDGVNVGCHGLDGENQCYNLCTNSGRYCATDPDNDLDRGISGADVVKESLRRICIWNYYGERNGIGAQWWDYLSEFKYRCDSEEFFTNEDCIKDAYKHSNVDGALIDQCMHDSGGLEGDTPNSFLQLELSKKKELGIVILPSTFVNTVAIHGSSSAKTVFKAICAGYAEGTVPDICTQCNTCPKLIECVTSKGICIHNDVAADGGRVSKRIFTVSLVFMVALFSGLGIWHWKMAREEMRDQVRGILAEYMPLDDEEQVNGSPMAFAKKGGS